jgi:hypothetical protein
MAILGLIAVPSHFLVDKCQCLNTNQMKNDSPNVETEATTTAIAQDIVIEIIIVPFNK